MRGLRALRTGRSTSVRDEPLERAFERSDATAYDAVYRRYSPRLYATALRVLRDPATAQDCMHDVLLRLWKRGDSYSCARGSLEAFLVTCVRNEALARVRRNAREDRLQRALPHDEEYRMDDDPIERARVARAIAQLTPLQAQMVEYAYFRALTLAEIARELNKPLGTVKSHISAALRALRAALRDEDVRHA